MKNVLYNSCPDEELFGRYIDGEDAAFDAIVERHGSFVLNYLWRYLGDREAAEDLTQEVFIKVVKASGSFKKGSKFRTWLFSIMINC
ncbi:MAG: sigma-70 family RNA polymerase sigma factor, partial [Deltaproteobacteria bacterium]|nr:sigma-70 family RNA polymerase sigma factor [Deltaproteobacteria bacterium]